MAITSCSTAPTLGRPPTAERADGARRLGRGSRRAGPWVSGPDPATGNYRPNPALGSGTYRVARLELERASGGIAVRGDLQGRLSLEAGDGPRRLRGAPRWRAAGWPRWAGTSSSRRLYLGTGTDGLPPHRSFAIGGRGTLVGEPFRAYGGRDVALGQLEWRFEVPVPAIPLGSFASTGRSMTVAPFLAAGVTGRPIAGLPWAATDGVRPVVGRGARVVHAPDPGRGRCGPPRRRFRAHRRRQSGLVGAVVAALIFPLAPTPADPPDPHNRQSRTMQFTDEWLVHTIEPLLPDGAVAAIRQEQASAPASLWEILVQRKIIGRRPDPEGHRGPLPVRRSPT